MNIVLTGSLGNISKPLVTELIAKGHSVTVISSSADRQKEIETLGAKAAIGGLEDLNFLAKTFEGADIVYLMEPNVNIFDPDADMDKSWTGIANCYKQAILESGVTKVIHLSSIGARTDKGNGQLKAHYYVERILGELPENVSIKFMRPVSFYTNTLGWFQSIKEQGAIFSSHGGDRKEPWVSPLDIAAAIAEEVELPFGGRKIRYVASDELSPNEVAAILGNAIGKPDLKWVTLTGEQMLGSLKQIGMNPTIAEGFVEMQAAQTDDTLYEDYRRHKPVLGKVKFETFAKEFAAIYNQNN